MNDLLNFITRGPADRSGNCNGWLPFFAFGEQAGHAEGMKKELEWSTPGITPFQA